MIKTTKRLVFVHDDDTVIRDLLVKAMHLMCASCFILMRINIILINMRYSSKHLSRKLFNLYMLHLVVTQWDFTSPNWSNRVKNPLKHKVPVVTILEDCIYIVYNRESLLGSKTNVILLVFWSLNATSYEG